jgi:LPS sulfotransferase NodH
VKDLTASPSPSNSDRDHPAKGQVPRLDYRDFQRTAIILSGYRSGSHLLKLSLASLAQMQGPPEPLNFGISGGKVFALGDHLATGGPQASLISHAPAAFHEFLAKFYASTERETKILFDLKYSQAFAFGVNGDMDMQLPVPVTLHEFAKLGVPVIHLVRRDVVAQAMSLLVAEQSGVYLRRKGDVASDDSAAPVRLSPRDVLRAARRFHHSRLHFNMVLSALGMRVLTMHYEDLASDTGVEQLRSALRFLGRYADVPASFATPTRRQSSESSVMNADDIRAHVRQRAPELLMP